MVRRFGFLLIVSLVGLAAVSLILLVYYGLLAKQSIGFAPDWRVGQTWKVRAFSSGNSR